MSRISSRTMVAGAVLLGVTLVGAAWLAYRPGPTGIDSAVLRSLIGTRSHGLTSVAKTVSLLFSPAAMAIWVVAIGVALVVRDRSLHRAVPIVAAAGVAAVADGLLKVAVARPRPPALEQIGTPETTFSYPSGHVTGTAVLIVALLVVVGVEPVRRFGWALLAGVVIALCAWTRLYLGAHWFSDVVGGAALGASAALLVPPMVTRVLAFASSPAQNRI